MAEGGHQWGISYTRPYIGNFVEETYKECIFRKGLFTLLGAVGIDGSHHASKVGHHGTHHAARQTATEEQRRHEFVTGVHEISEEVVDKLLRQLAGLHIGIHIDFRNIEAGILQHALYRDDVRMHLTP